LYSTERLSSMNPLQALRIKHRIIVFAKFIITPV
jgi:hypothetical protein